MSQREVIPLEQKEGDFKTISYYDYTPLRAGYQFKIYDDEFECPDTFEIVSIEYCESFCKGNGCKKKTTCKGYAVMKNGVGPDDVIRSD